MERMERAGVQGECVAGRRSSACGGEGCGQWLIGCAWMHALDGASERQAGLVILYNVTMYAL